MNSKNSKKITENTLSYKEAMKIIKKMVLLDKKLKRKIKY